MRSSRCKALCKRRRHDDRILRKPAAPPHRDPCLFRISVRSCRSAIHREGTERASRPARAPFTISIAEHGDANALAVGRRPTRPPPPPQRPPLQAPPGPSSRNQWGAPLSNKGWLRYELCSKGARADVPRARTRHARSRDRNSRTAAGGLVRDTSLARCAACGPCHLPPAYSTKEHATFSGSFPSPHFAQASQAGAAQAWWPACSCTRAG